MKKTAPLLSLLFAASPLAMAQSADDYTNFIRQVQLPSGVVWDVPVDDMGEQQSALEINPGGARFELWTVDTANAIDYLLDTRYVGAYVPVATVVLRSEDPYAVIPRTRADRPFYVDLTVAGLRSGAEDPEPSKRVSFLRHVQSYGEGGTGYGIDHTQAALLGQVYIEGNGSATLTYAINSVPGADRAKVRGEERFSVFSLPDYQAPESQLASQFIQIWPVADGAMSGITNNQLIRFKMPVVTLNLNDLYPDSHTYAQIYQGAPQLGVTGKIVSGSSLIIKDTIPQSRVLVLSDYDDDFSDDGQWTMELVTKTPFGLDRLAYVTFMLDRTLEMRGSVTTID